MITTVVRFEVSGGSTLDELEQRARAALSALDPEATWNIEMDVADDMHVGTGEVVAWRADVTAYPSA